MFFVPKQDFTHPLGATSSISEKHRPQNALQWHPCYFFLGQNSFFGGTFHAWGAQAVIWGGTAPKCSSGSTLFSPCIELISKKSHSARNAIIFLAF